MTTNENYIYSPPDDCLEQEHIIYPKNKDYGRLTPNPNFIVDTTESIIPSCYKSVRLPEIKMELLHEETLFYIFYNCVGEKVQLDAYNELIARNYYYHTKVDFFVMLSNPVVADNKRHCVSFFNCYTWSKENIALWFDKEFVDNLCQ